MDQFIALYHQIIQITGEICFIRFPIQAAFSVFRRIEYIMPAIIPVIPFFRFITAGLSTAVLLYQFFYSIYNKLNDFCLCYNFPFIYYNPSFRPYSVLSISLTFVKRKLRPSENKPGVHPLKVFTII